MASILAEKIDAQAIVVSTNIEADISTSSYSVHPVYGSRPAAEACIMIYPTPPECLPGTEITGYKASKSVTVTLDAEGDIDAGQIIDTPAPIGDIYPLKPA